MSRVCAELNMKYVPSRCSVCSVAAVAASLLDTAAACFYFSEGTAYEYTPDEADDLHFAFDACISAETEEARGGKVLEISMLFQILKALTSSADSDDLTREDIDRLVDKYVHISPFARCV